MITRCAHYKVEDKDAHSQLAHTHVVQYTSLDQHSSSCRGLGCCGATAVAVTDGRRPTTFLIASNDFRLRLVSFAPEPRPASPPAAPAFLW